MRSAPSWTAALQRDVLEAPAVDVAVDAEPAGREDAGNARRGDGAIDHVETGRSRERGVGIGTDECPVAADVAGLPCPDGGHGHAQVEARTVDQLGVDRRDTPGSSAPDGSLERVQVEHRPCGLGVVMMGTGRRRHPPGDCGDVGPGRVVVAPPLTRSRGLVVDLGGELGVVRRRTLDDQSPQRICGLGAMQLAQPWLLAEHDARRRSSTAGRRGPPPAGGRTRRRSGPVR